MKKVLLIVVDACATRIVQPAMQAGHLPNLQALAAAGTLHPDCIAVFPSITPAATSAIITGCYPKDHGISGAYWYEPAQHKVVYYGYDIWAILTEGFGKFAGDFLVRLNQRILKADTLYQLVERSGRQAASLNYVIFHGDVAHPLQGEWLLDLLPDSPSPDQLYGPAITYFGDFIQTPLPPDGENLSYSGGPLDRFGFSDQAGAELLAGMIERRALPDFTVAYFPENDARSHDVGPEQALEQLQYVDGRLGECFRVAGGLERLLDEVCVLLTGDHSQSDVIQPEEEAGIRLDELLAHFDIADAGTPMQRPDDLVICPNLRTAQIYFHSPDSQRVDQAVESLLSDGRVDQVLWNAGLLSADERGYRICTRQRGSLQFWPGEDGPQTAKDRYGCTWSWNGDLGAVDAVVENGRIRFGAYPNAFERINGILELPTAGHLWVTAQPGYEFCLEHTPVHAGGGSHASLHRLDSQSPLFIAGTPTEIDLPGQLRSVDIAPLCLSVLGVEPRVPVGASHVRSQH